MRGPVNIEVEAKETKVNDIEPKFVGKTTDEPISSNQFRTYAAPSGSLDLGTKKEIETETQSNKYNPLLIGSLLLILIVIVILLVRYFKNKNK